MIVWGQVPYTKSNKSNWVKGVVVEMRVGWGKYKILFSLPLLLNVLCSWEKQKDFKEKKNLVLAKPFYSEDLHLALAVSVNRLADGIWEKLMFRLKHLELA